jgi:hypothetical protein
VYGSALRPVNTLLVPASRRALPAVRLRAGAAVTDVRTALLRHVRAGAIAVGLILCDGAMHLIFKRFLPLCEALCSYDGGGMFTRTSSRTFSFWHVLTLLSEFFVLMAQYHTSASIRSHDAATMETGSCVYTTPRIRCSVTHGKVSPYHSFLLASPPPTLLNFLLSLRLIIIRSLVPLPPSQNPFPFRPMTLRPQNVQASTA